MTAPALTAIVIPIGAGTEAALDTLDSVGYYCPEPHLVVVVDDCTSDGTYEALTLRGGSDWRILRNPRPMGIHRLAGSLCSAYRFVLAQTRCSLVLRLDQDALIIKPGVISDAAEYASANPSVGLFGVYETDYNRPRSFDAHRKLIDTETQWWWKVLGLAPSWTHLLTLAERRGYRRGMNVFGGAYFVTRKCLEGMCALQALDVPYNWHSVLMEDVYFSMAAVAAGFDLGHFAAPDGPLCLEWRGLPYCAADLVRSHYKLVHSVDKGQNTDPSANNGRTAREVFKSLRNSTFLEHDAGLTK